MSDHIESLARRVEGAIASDRLAGYTDNKFLKAVLWEINSESWERGVMWSRMLGSVPPPREPNPYLPAVPGEALP